MDIDNWLTYVLAYFVISAIPGPSVLMIIGQSLSRGLVPAMFCVLGDLVGGIVVMSVSYIGLGVILATSSELFFALKWLGVIYMAYLGVLQILATRRLTAQDLNFKKTTEHYYSSARAGFLTGVLNPKAIMFYVSFLAQFIDPNQAKLPQFLILMLTSTIVVAIVLGAYAVSASRLRKTMQGIKARKRMGYLGGSLLLGGSALMASTR